MIENTVLQIVTCMGASAMLALFVTFLKLLISRNNTFKSSKIRFQTQSGVSVEAAVTPNMSGDEVGRLISKLEEASRGIVDSGPSGKGQPIIVRAAPLPYGSSPLASLVGVALALIVLAMVMALLQPEPQYGATISATRTAEAQHATATAEAQHATATAEVRYAQPVSLGDFVTARGVGPLNAPVSTTTVFSSEDAVIYAVVEAYRFDEGHRVFARWFIPNRAAEDTGEIVADRDYRDTYIEFHIGLPNGTNLESGEYEVQLVVDGEVAATATFTVQRAPVE